MIKTVEFSANFVVCLNSDYTTAEIQLKFLVADIMVIQRLHSKIATVISFLKIFPKKRGSKSEKICY